MFINILKKRFWRRYTLVGILIALITILLTFYVRGYEDLQYYHNLANGKYDFLMTAEQEPVLNEEAIDRSNTTRLEMEKSYIYSFDSVFNRALYSYDFFAPILLTLPALFFLYERKNKHFHYVLLRMGSYRKYILREGLSCAITGWLIAMIPCFIAWLVMVIFCPMPYDLNQTPTPNFHAMLGFLYTEGTLSVAYLLHMLIYSLPFFFLSLLAFASSLLIKYEALLIFIPILYTNIITSVLDHFSLGLYSPAFILGEINTTLSYGPVIVSCFYTFLLSFIIILSVGKERVING